MSDHLKIRLLECRILEVFVNFSFDWCTCDIIQNISALSIWQLSMSPKSTKAKIYLCMIAVSCETNNCCVMNETTPGSEYCSSPTMYRKWWWFVRTRWVLHALRFVARQTKNGQICGHNINLPTLWVKELICHIPKILTSNLHCRLKLRPHYWSKLRVGIAYDITVMKSLK